MKHFKLTFFLTVLMSMVGLQVFAYDAKIDGIYYNLSSHSATVVKGTDKYTGNIVIPSYFSYGGLGYNVTGIESNAFSLCNELTSITIPNSVISIGDNAFYGCSGITSIIIPTSVTNIGGNPFKSCSNIKTIIVTYGNTKYDSRSDCNAIIEKGSNALIAGCKNTIIPSSVTSIGSKAFSGSSGLTSIEIPNSVTSIGEEAFYACSGLTSIEIPNGVTSIGEHAFWYCSGLSSITIPNSVKSIGVNPFSSCSNLKSITVTYGNTKYDSRNDCNAIVEKGSNVLIAGCKNTVIPSSVTSIGEYAFSGCYGLASIEIPNSVTNIGNYAFWYCSGLTSIEIPNSVTSIGKEAFGYTPWYNNKSDGLVYAGKVAYKYKGTMPSETNIVLKSGTKGIGGAAFENCVGLTSIDIPNSVINIGNNAFYGCYIIPSITIPNSVTSIGDFAFAQCNNLTTVTVNKEAPISISSSVFTSINQKNATLYVPEGSIDAYKAATYWKNFKEIKAINVSVTGITLNESTINFNLIGETMQLTATVLPIEAVNKNVNWTTANTSVCTVSSTGLVTATGEGECYVIATTADGGYTAYCTVNVSLVAPNVAVTGITLSPSVLNFKHVGGTKQIVANVLPADATNKSVNWMSATPAVCSVSETGLVTALGSGNGVVIATTVDGGKMAYCTINVTPTDHATITMGSNGIATFSDEDALDFTSVSGVKAYIASGYNPATGDLTMTRVYKVPAGEGLLVKGAAGSYDVPYEETSAYYANLLVGVSTAMTVNPTDGDYTNFILANDEVKGIGFYPLASAGEIGANKAYLQLPTSILPAASRSLRMVFEDEEDVTGINALNDKEKMKNDKAVYDLQGRRVVKPTRGLYIKDGKKIMVK